MTMQNRALMRSGLDRLLGRMDRHPSAVSFVILGLIFLATAGTLPYHIDPTTNVLTAWKLGTSGSVVLEEYDSITGPEYFNVANQLVATPRGPVSKYPPGTALLAAPLYTVIGDREPATLAYYHWDQAGEQLIIQTELPKLWPAGLVASLTTVGAMAALAAAMKSFLGGRWAWIGAMILGLGTSLWSVAADALWQHGPAALGLTVGLFGMSRSRYLMGSSGFAFAVLVRPQTAVIAAVVGIWAAFRDRSLMTLLKSGAIPGLAAAAYVGFNRWAFGDVIERDAGGYWVSGALQRGLWGTLEQIVGAFVSPSHGLLTWSPFLALGLVGIVWTWSSAPWWAKAGAIAGMAYLIIQVRGNGYVGGEGFRWYRYQLEAMVAAAPLLVYSLRRLWSSHQNWRRSIVLTVGFAIAVHGYAAIFSLVA